MVKRIRVIQVELNVNVPICPPGKYSTVRVDDLENLNSGVTV